MAANLKGRSFLKLLDFSPGEIADLLSLSATLKANKRADVRGMALAGRNVALIFEKASTRTRCAFVTACVDEGAHPEYLGKGDIQFGKKETVADTARVLGRMFDGIQFRVHEESGLTREEMDIMKEHAYLGYKIVSKIPFLAEAAEIVYAHQERYDGTGYPRGLKGDLIPMSARIFTVADVWDALTSARPYRRAWPTAKVIEYIRENSGVRFDPRKNTFRFLPVSTTRTSTRRASSAAGRRPEEAPSRRTRRISRASSTCTRSSRRSSPWRSR